MRCLNMNKDEVLEEDRAEYRREQIDPEYTEEEE